MATAAQLDAIVVTGDPDPPKAGRMNVRRGDFDRLSLHFPRVTVLSA